MKVKLSLVQDKQHSGKVLSEPYFSEGAAQFDVRCCGKLSLGAHGQRACVHAVQVGHDQQEVRGGFDGQEAAAGHVDAERVVEALHGRAHRRLQLDDVQTAVEGLETQQKPVSQPNVHTSIVLCNGEGMKVTLGLTMISMSMAFFS